jgi:hypothetical protein
MATSPLLFDNLPHWGEHFDTHFKVDLWLTLLSKCSPQWGRLSNKRGLVADGGFRSNFQGRLVRTLFGLRIVAKCFTGKRIRKRWFGCQTLRLGSVKSCRCVCLTHMMIARRCVCRTHTMTGSHSSMPMCLSNSHYDRES